LKTLDIVGRIMWKWTLRQKGRAVFLHCLPLEDRIDRVPKSRYEIRILCWLNSHKSPHLICTAASAWNLEKVLCSSSKLPLFIDESRQNNKVNSACVECLRCKASGKFPQRKQRYGQIDIYILSDKLLIIDGLRKNLHRL